MRSRLLSLPVLATLILGGAGCDVADGVPLRIRDARTATRDSLLIRAAAGGDRTTVARLIRLGVHPDVRDPNGRTALMAAAANGETEVVRTLVERGASVEARSEGGSTALLEAVRQSRLIIAGYLLEHGATPCARDDRGRRARDFAASSGDDELLELVRTFEERSGGC